MSRQQRAGRLPESTLWATTDLDSLGAQGLERLDHGCPACRDQASQKRGHGQYQDDCAEDCEVVRLDVEQDDGQPLGREVCDDQPITA